MPPRNHLRTKIVATVGPACEKPETLLRLVRAGVSVARINLAHGTPADHARFAANVRWAARQVGRPIAVMADLAGPKIRVGQLHGGRLKLEPGQRVHLTTQRLLGTDQHIPVTEPRLAKDARRGDPIFLADGSLELRVLEVDNTDVTCEVVTGGLLLTGKGVNLPRTRLQVPTFTAKDQRDLQASLTWGVDVLALSFVRERRDVDFVRRLLGRRQLPLIAKIEKREAVRNLPAILEASDGVMVARGDLGVEASVEEVPLLQKRIIRLANDSAKPVITATQMLKSMVEAPHPTRAEATDIANAVLDGTDAVMLSEETAMGRYPVQAVETMARIAWQAEAALEPTTLRTSGLRRGFTAPAVSEAAVRVAQDVGAKAIVTPTFGGATPRFVAHWRPRIPIFALSENARTVQFLCLSWGVQPIHVARMGAIESTLALAHRVLKKAGVARRGDRFVLTAGYPRDKASNLMTVQDIT